MRTELVAKGEMEQLARVEARIRWRQERVSLPRCLCCGSTRVEPMGDDFRHPGCGGRLVAVGTPLHSITAFVQVVPAQGPPERGWLWAWWSRRTRRST